jgi:hypothetical protein
MPTPTLVSIFAAMPTPTLVSIFAAMPTPTLVSIFAAMPTPTLVPISSVPTLAAVIMFRFGRTGDRDYQRRRGDDE